MNRTIERPLDAVLIPGGGLNEVGEPADWVIPRLDRAAQIYRHVGGVTLITESRGTTHLAPPFDGNGRPIFEADASARYLVERHEIDPRHILTEPYSDDTIGNAYFTRTVHTDPTGMRDLHVVTTDWHAPRTEAIFRWVFGLRGGPNNGRPYSLSFDATPSVGLNEKEVAGRVAKEANGLKSVQANAERYTTMQDFHRWLFTEHAAYNTERLFTKRRELTPQERASYGRLS
jgi:hypothetical protein